MTRADVFWLVVTFLFGSVFGSFLNVCIYRLPLGKSLLWPASHCPKCFQPVGPWNIPILGYFLLGGKCHACGERFSIQYPLVELLTALILSYFYYLLVVERGAPVPVYAAYVVLAMLLVVASFVDLKWKIIPRKVTVSGIVLALAFSTAYPRLHSAYIPKGGGPKSWMDAINLWGTRLEPVEGLLASLAGMAAGVIVILVVRFLGTAVFRREAMGLGDAKLMAVIGGFLGWRAIPLVFLLAACIGAVVGLVWYLKTRSREIPLGPFLALGALLVLLWGNEILNWWVVTVMRFGAELKILSYGL